MNPSNMSAEWWAISKCTGILVTSDNSAVLTREGLDALIAALNTAGYRGCGPIERDGAGLVIHAEEESGERLALSGVSACELAAIAIQDRVFMTGACVNRTPDCASGHPSPALLAGVAWALQRAPVGRRTDA
jgi:hypothetical protein